MNHLDAISTEELQDALDNGDGKKPTQRLLAAIRYKNGVTQTELAGWYNVQRRTIYSWLKRLVEPLEQAVSDDNELEESEKSQKNNNKNSKQPFTNHPARSASTRRLPRRSSSSSSSKKRTAWSTRSRVADGC